jgi:hypothetical protein
MIRVVRGVTLIIAIIVAAELLTLPATSADAESIWTKPQLLFQSDGYTSFPLVVADPKGDVHLVFMNLNQRGREVSVNTQGSFLYARLHDGQWSTPTDVVVPPGGGPVNLPSLTLDAQGYLHLVFQGGTANQIYYTRAHVSDASSAHGWSPPQVLSDGGGNDSSISASNDGVLHFVYAGEDGTLHYRRSDDDGQTWSNGVTIVGPNDAAGPGTQADYPRVLSDSPGRVHVTWNEYRLPDGWPSVGAFYAQSVDEGTTWSAPRRVAPQDYGFVSMVSSQPGVIDRVWNSIGDIGERRHQQSRDGGQSWSPSERINDPAVLYSGFTGFPGIAVDSAGILHVITTLDTRVPGGYGIYELTWNGRTWSEPTLISTGVGAGSTAASPERSIEESQVTISRGNRVHAVFEENFGNIWYTSRLLDTPELPARSVPAPRALSLSAASTPTVAPTRRPAPTATPQLVPAAAQPVPASTDAALPDPISGLLLTFIPSVLLVALVLLVRLAR